MNPPDPSLAQFTLNLQPARQVWTVSELTACIRTLLEAHFDDIWVEGEISNFRQAQSGHVYFTLKDEKAQIRCVCFSRQVSLLRFRPEDGLKVTVRGRISVYENRGDYQLYVEHLEPAGLGALQLAFEQLKRRLEAEGLFDASRKKPLPLFPERIVLITSPAGAAVHDLLRVLRRRLPAVRLRIYPVHVQGEAAAEEIVAAIHTCNAQRLGDVLILARGGGSLEDLWPFNDERVARAIAASRIPIVTGIGHETDFTIADFVADLRAPTPSAAAEMVVRSKAEFRQQITQLTQQLSRHLTTLLLQRRNRLQNLRLQPAFQRPFDLVGRAKQRLDDLCDDLYDQMDQRLQRARRQLGELRQGLSPLHLRIGLARLSRQLERTTVALEQALTAVLVANRQQLDGYLLQLKERSPLRLLERGYAICYRPDGSLLRGVSRVQPGDAVMVQMVDGRLETVVRRTHPSSKVEP